MLLRMSVRIASLLAFAVALSGCASRYDPEAPLIPMGDFRLGHLIVVDEGAEMLLVSRKARPGEWKAALTEEVKRQLGRYEGDRFYNIGIKVDGYALAIPGIPVVAKPQSMLVVTVSVWDDAKRKKLDEPKRLIVTEKLSPETFIGSGLTQNRHRQMRNLSRNMAVAIHKYLLTHPEWFGLPPLPEEKERPAQGGGSDN